MEGSTKVNLELLGKNERTRVHTPSSPAWSALADP